MQWESWQAFWAMGGAGWFVWGSYGVTALLMALELVLVLRRPSNTLQRLRRLRRATVRASQSPSSAPARAAQPSPGAGPR